MAGLGAYLAEKRISREMLNLPVNPESRNQIALKIGKNWECLATCIGISSQEVFDLKEMYPNSPQDQRLGMMNRWEELYGSEATYLKLIEGLEQTGRRDLTELLIRVVMSRPAFSKARDEEGRLNVASILNTDGVPASTHNPSTDKPGYLPLRRDPISHISMPSHYDDFGMHMGTPSGPHSEPAKKHVERPLFSSSLPGLENAVVRRAAFTPVSDRISSEAMGHNEIKMFRNHYR